MLRIAARRCCGLAALLGTSLLVFFPASGGADATSLRQGAASLRAQNAALASQSSSALVELYSLDSRLSAARDRVSELEGEVAALREQLGSVRHQLAVAQHVARVSRVQLGRRLVSIYENGEPDPLAVVLGAQSLSEAVTKIDQLTAVAGQDRAMLEQVVRSRVALRRLKASLSVREARLQALEGEAAAAVSSLEGARTDRLRYLAQLSSERRLNDQRIQSLEARASAAEARSRALAASEALAPAPPPAAAPAVTAPAPSTPSPSGRTLTVVATAYSLGGSTATGLPVGPGVVAVDPSVIPLGTHMTIPGYGEGVAADTGSAIQGARIDVWVATETQAQQWGSRTVTITLH